MKKDNVIQEKSFTHAVRIVKLFLHLRRSGVERALIIQLLKSGTSIGANVEEAIGGSSKKDFSNKLKIAYKEGRETHFWLRVLYKSDLLESNLATSFLKDCDEILKILGSILKTIKPTSDQGLRNSNS